MNIIAIIPARYASTRLPAKPLVDICGKTMIQRVYEQAKQSKLINNVIVATDDELIAEEVASFGGTAELTPVDIHSGSDRIALAAKNKNADIVVNVQGDEPLIDPQLIDQTIQVLIDDKQAVVGTAVKKISSSTDVFNPNVVKAVLDVSHYALYFSRSPIPHARDEKLGTAWLDTIEYYKHFGIYVYRANFLQKFTRLAPTPLEKAEKLEQLRILENGYKIKCVITEYESFPVDTPEDLQKVIESLSR
jgi:3-deoxy-manno-octulosonate cytidylyltransferase (CMP-KDO synthetase)